MKEHQGERELKHLCLSINIFLAVALAVPGFYTGQFLLTALVTANAFNPAIQVNEEAVPTGPTDVTPTMVTSTERSAHRPRITKLKSGS